MPRRQANRQIAELTPGDALALIRWRAQRLENRSPKVAQEFYACADVLEAALPKPIDGVSVVTLDPLPLVDINVE